MNRKEVLELRYKKSKESQRKIFKTKENLEKIKADAIKDFKARIKEIKSCIKTVKRIKWLK